MAKRIWYSTPLKYYWDNYYKEFKKLYPEFPDSDIYKFLKDNMLNAPLRLNESMEARELEISGLELWNEDYKGELLHIFFLEKSLRDFLKSVPLSSLESVRKYLFENGKKGRIKYSKISQTEDVVTYNFGLHIPHEKEGYGFSLILFESGTVELFFSKGTYQGRMSDTFYKEYNRKAERQPIEQCDMYRLAINTLAYLRCFPECVEDGVPG